MRKSILSFTLLFSLLIAGCVSHKPRNIEESQKPIATEEVIPFATPQELKALQTNEDIINYEVAHKAALLDMASFADEFSKLGAILPYTLSSEPVIIYELSGIPKFYEFIVWMVWYSHRFLDFGN